MGLDMHLTGEKFLTTDLDNPQNILMEDGFRLKQRNLELGQWWKHPNLHGFIVEEFAEGIDNCRPIDVYAERIDQIIEAIQQQNLPHTEGFFFGESDDSSEQREEDLKIFKQAKAWLSDKRPGEWRSVTYQASW